ncbi:MAG: DUF1963 domain-containing protein [Pseudomonadota bacterium]
MKPFDSIRKFFSARLQPSKQCRAAATQPQPLRSAPDLDALLEATGCPQATALVRQVARTCFHIFPASPGTKGKLGCSRLGGAPDLPAGASWPRAKNGQLLTFYGQIKLSDVSAITGPPLLPAEGLLSIFCGEIDCPAELNEVHVSIIPPGFALQASALPPVSDAFADGRIGCLNPVVVRFEQGLSFPTERWAFLRALESSAPDGDVDALLQGLSAAPEGAIGQFLGLAQFSGDDVQSEAYFAEIGRVNQDRLVIWESWDEWGRAKAMQSRMGNGQLHRPWSSLDDANVKWILENRAAIAAGTEKWMSLLWIGSNKQMNLWINDADPIYFLAKINDDGSLDLSKVRAGATQS